MGKFKDKGNHDLKVFSESGILGHIPTVSSCYR